MPANGGAEAPNVSVNCTYKHHNNQKKITIHAYSWK